jgi:hypothetical protein
LKPAIKPGSLVKFCEVNYGVDTIGPIGYFRKSARMELFLSDDTRNYVPSGTEIGLVVSAPSDEDYCEILLNGSKFWFNYDNVFLLEQVNT